MKIVKILGVIFLLLIALIFGWLLTGQYDASENAIAISSVFVEENDYYSNEEQGNDVGFIFYPGAKVDPLAYSYLQDVNANVYIADFPFGIAFLNMNVASTIIEENPEVEHWYIGGHSLGGVAATEYAKTDETIEGCVLMASYPSEAMTSSDFEILAFFGTSDGLVTDYKEKEKLLPQNSQIVEIEGGNHAQFGDYGSQDGDSISSISIEKQHEIIIENINKFIEE